MELHRWWTVSSLVFVRPPSEADAFILASLMRSMADIGVDPVPVRSAVTRLARDPATRVLLAHPPGHPDDYAGWAMGALDGLVFVYVRKSLRKLGIGASLITEVTDTVPIRCAFWTRSFSRMARAGYPIDFDLDLQEQVLKFAR